MFLPGIYPGLSSKSVSESFFLDFCGCFFSEFILTIYFSFFFKFVLVGVSWMSCGNPLRFFFVFFSGVTSRVPLGIVIGYCPEVLNAPFGISLDFSLQLL